MVINFSERTFQNKIGRKCAVCLLILCCLSNSSCIKKLDLYKEGEEAGSGNGTNTNKEKEVICETDFIYPFYDEVKNAQIEITIRTKSKLPEIKKMKPVIPPLKYNKSWLMMLTQDDCKQVAFCCTWAAIHGKPLTKSHFYDLAHLQEGDLPPDAYRLGKTLGSTDGAGNEVRFSFVTTLAPEWGYMDKATKVNKGFRENSYRFTMKSALLWGNAKEMLNYGVGISFHDVKTANEDDKDAILPHYKTVQDEFLNKLSGRGCKMLAEPSGHRAYCDAALEYPPIQTMTAQSTPITVLYPHQPAKDLNQVIIYRSFFGQTTEDKSPSPVILKKAIIKELQKSETERPAIYAGAHSTDTEWVDFLLWLNDEYGKDGLDNVWMPNQEEYYEYNYYRIHSTINEPVAIDDQTFQLTLDLPSGEFFYYPSITINCPNITMDEIATIETNNTVTGLSYANYIDGIMLNIDCRKHLAEHAENFVKRYEKDPTDESAKADAIYFASMLKESEKKNELLNRIN